MRIAQVSDTHFGTERLEVLGGLLGMLSRLRPDVIVLSGDITQRARESQYASARRFVDAWPASAHRIIVPGNHDIPFFNAWRRFTAPYESYERTFGPRESLWRFDGGAILALDATHPRRRKDGYLPPAHLRERLHAARAGGAPDDLLLVVAHQPLWTAWGEDKRQTLIDREATAQLLSEARADLVFSGHVHVPFIGTSAVSDPRLPWRFVMSGAGTAISRRTRPSAPNSFNVVELDAPAARLRVVRHDWDGAAFRAASPLDFRRDANGWQPQVDAPALST